MCVFVRLRIAPVRIKLARQILHGGSGTSWAGNLSFWGTLLTQKPKIGRIGHPPDSNVQGGKTYRNRVPIKFARHVDVGSACVDIRPSPKTDVLVNQYSAEGCDILLAECDTKGCDNLLAGCDTEGCDNLLAMCDTKGCDKLLAMCDTEGCDILVAQCDSGDNITEQ